MEQLTLHHGAAADSSADSKVHEIGEPACGTVTCFAEGCAVDVRVESYRDAERLANPAGEIDIAPGEFGRRGDMAGAEVEGSERGDADGVRRVSAEELDGAADGLLGGSGGKLRGFEIVRAGADGADKLGSAGLDAAVAR